MKYLILGILIFLVGCVSQEKFIMEESEEPNYVIGGWGSVSDTPDDITIMEAPKDLRVEAMVMIEAPKYEELVKALMSADDVIDSLNSYISELEWELYKSKHSTEARVTELESDGWQVHIVRPGDFLSKIALHYYGDMCYTTYLWSLNSNIIPKLDLIYPGQVLKIKRREY